LGFLWSFLDPLINAAVLYVIFTFLFARGIENFAVFLLIGILLWNFFASSISQGSRVIMDNGGLIKKIRLPREVFPISTVLANLIHFFLAFLVLILFLIVFQVPFNPAAWLFLPIVIVLATAFNVAVALFSSSVSVYFRDFPYIVESIRWILSPRGFVRSI
jgi:lipopolysaccharide transport system permease protein